MPQLEVEVLNPEDIKDWMKLAKYHKGLWVKATDRGDMTPTVFAERKGEVLCAVVAPKVDKMLGLQAAAICRKALQADYLTMIVDTHIYHGKPGETEEEFLKNKPQDMQKACDEEDACERGLIADCLICHRIGQDKKLVHASMPYYYHGKDTVFRWLNDPDGFHENLMDEHNPDHVIEGMIPDAMRQIISLPTFEDEPRIQMIASKLKLTNQFGKQMYHTARAAYQALSVEGYMVFDYYNHDLPWEAFKKLHNL